MNQETIDNLSDHALSSTYLGVVAEIDALHVDFGDNFEKEPDATIREMIRLRVKKLQKDLLLIVIELAIRGLSIQDITRKQ